MFKNLSRDMENIENVTRYLQIKTTTPAMKNTLGWINGKLNISEGRICELKHIKELTKIKHTEKIKRETKNQ